MKKINEKKLKFNENFTEESYQNEYLGEFIDNKLVNRNRRRSYRSDSGTISDKVSFCKKSDI